MTPLPFNPGHASPSELPEQRQVPRYIACGVGCALGRVIDMSAGGMQVLHEGRPELGLGEAASMMIQSDECTVAVCCRVAWVEPIAGRQHVLGLAFVGMDESTKAAIEGLIARTCGGLAPPMCFMAA